MFNLILFLLELDLWLSFYWLFSTCLVSFCSSDLSSLFSIDISEYFWMLHLHFFNDFFHGVFLLTSLVILSGLIIDTTLSIWTSDLYYLIPVKHRNVTILSPFLLSCNIIVLHITSVMLQAQKYSWNYYIT